MSMKLKDRIARAKAWSDQEFPKSSKTREDVESRIRDCENMIVFCQADSDRDPMPHTMLLARLLERLEDFN